VASAPPTAIPRSSPIPNVSTSAARPNRHLGFFADRRPTNAAGNGGWARLEGRDRDLAVF